MLTHIYLALAHNRPAGMACLQCTLSVTANVEEPRADSFQVLQARKDWPKIKVWPGLPKRDFTTADMLPQLLEHGRFVMTG